MSSTPSAKSREGEAPAEPSAALGFRFGESLALPGGRLLAPVFFCLTLVGCHQAELSTAVTGMRLRVATFNSSMSRDDEGALHSALAEGDDLQARRVAEILQHVRPDIVLLQEFDHDPTGKAYDDFQQNYLLISQNGAEPIAYPYHYSPSVNTGEPSGADLSGDGVITSPEDCHGWGNYPGHYGMVLLSRYPIDHDALVSFRTTRWIDRNAQTLSDTGYYSEDAMQAIRLSSKTHADVPVVIAGRPLHLLISHPTPPVFDGDEDRNGYRNKAEIGMWLAYLSTPDTPALLSDEGHLAMLAPNARFVLLGDLNADPNDGESRPGAMLGLLSHPRIQAVAPGSLGGVEAARHDGGLNAEHRGDPAHDTADWGDDPGFGSGNLRVDYVLPSVGLRVVDSGVFWPTRESEHAPLLRASDHRLVWIDLAWE